MSDSFDDEADALVEAHLAAGSESPVRLRQRIAAALRDTDRRRPGSSSFEADVRRELSIIAAALVKVLAKLSEPPQVRHASDLNRLEPLLDMAAVYDRHRHRRREEGT